MPRGCPLGALQQCHCLSSVQGRLALGTGERFIGLHHVVEVGNGDLARLSHPVDLLFDEA